MTSEVTKPPKHRFWGAGEADCPKDIKAGNGELHTLQCKVCGEKSPPDEFCWNAIPDGEAEHPKWLSSLLNILDSVEDEGDRAYFGSTNDVDELKCVVGSLQNASYPLRYFKRPDMHRQISELLDERKAAAERERELVEAYGKLRRIAAEHLADHPNIERTRRLMELPQAPAKYQALAKYGEHNDQ